MIVSEIITKVRHLRVAEDVTGTGFLTERDFRLYLVTARHLVEHLFSAAVIEIQRDGIWELVEVDAVGHHPSADVSVLALRTSVGPILGPVPLSSEGIIYGQDAFFLGFPHGWFGDVGSLLSGYPLPFVKRALVSNMSHGSDAEIFLDGINNPGFSGGPVVFKNTASNAWQITGVISGYRYIEQEVINAGVDSSMKYEVNTGIIVVSPISAVVELIDGLSVA